MNNDNNGLLICASLLVASSVMSGCAAQAEGVSEQTDDAIIGARYATQADLDSTVNVDLLALNRQCGGAVVAARTVLVSKHCVRDAPAEGIRVNYGTIKAYLGPEVGVAGILRHPDLGVDLAVLKLAQPLNGQELARIPWKSQLKGMIGSNLRVAGFGRWGSADTGAYPYLRIGSMKVTEWIHIVPVPGGYGMYGVNGPDGGGFLAAGESSPTTGDLGAPAYVTLEGTKYLVGLAIGSMGIDGPGVPVAFTLLAAHKDWIRSTSGESIP